MRQIGRVISAALLLLPLASADAARRSHAATVAFQRSTPCPSTAAPRGSCPGYVIDHVTPLCAGGADAPENMQWQTIEDGKLKDRRERALCHAMRRASLP